MPFENTNAGVPQGSVLGSLLFLIHVYDKAGNLISLTRLCAEEKSFSYSSTSPNKLANVLNSDLEQILVWSKDSFGLMILIGTRLLLCYSPVILLQMILK